MVNISFNTIRTKYNALPLAMKYVVVCGPGLAVLLGLMLIDHTFYPKTHTVMRVSGCIFAACFAVYFIAQSVKSFRQAAGHRTLKWFIFYIVTSGIAAFLLWCLFSSYYIETYHFIINLFT